MTPAETVVPAESTDQLWDVNRIDQVLGVGPKIGQVQAATRRLAEAVAKATFGGELLVTIAGGGPSRRARKDSR